jgi:hypothetical protein
VRRLSLGKINLTAKLTVLKTLPNRPAFGLQFVAASTSLTNVVKKFAAKMMDRYPMDVGQDGAAPRVMQMNVANLYDFLTGAGIHKRA